jgi:CRISPR system Cascade subunit CasD
MGVRVDCEGSIRKDFQTAGMGLDGNPKIWKVSGGVNSNLMTSDRFYLADAKFLVGLEGNATLLQDLQYALQNPVWFLFLGRKSFIPSERIWLRDGIREDSIETIFAQHEWLGLENPPSKLRCILEDPSGTIVQHDSVQSFKPRRFLPRRMRIDWVNNPSYSIVEEDI